MGGHRRARFKSRESGRAFDRQYPEQPTGADWKGLRILEEFSGYVLLDEAL
jgi:hypothetical protein